jgi:peptide subunit release factor 1 (eRF1)
VAEVEVPFPPLTGDLVEHATRARTVGVLLARRGGHAAGVFAGTELVASKTGSRHVQGRTAAGGWSQQRFARRREGQAAVAAGAAADDAARVLLSRPLDGLVLGGDRATVDAVLADARLAPLRRLVTGRLLEVPDPRLSVLQRAPFRDVWIRVVDG